MRLQPGADQLDLSEIEAHITQGVSLPLVSSPSGVAYSNTPTVSQHADDVRTRLLEYMQFGAVIQLPSDAHLADSSLRIQPLHVIIKAGNFLYVTDATRAARQPSTQSTAAMLVVQPICEVVEPQRRSTRSHVSSSTCLVTSTTTCSKEYFTYSCVDDAVEASHPNCWYGKLDLSNCFLSFPLHPSVRKYFCFRFDDKLYQFTHMPFGLSTAPRVCTQLVSVVDFALSELGITDIRYLDDFVLIAASFDEMARHLSLAQSAIAQFGLVVNPAKTEGPAQSLSFLGIQLDSVNRTVSCTPQRIDELTTLLRSLLRQRVITRAHAASLIGKLSFAARVLPGARPFMRRMLDALHKCKSRRHSTPIRIDPGFRDDLRFWVQQLHHWNGRQQWRSSRAAPYVFASDASLRVLRLDYAHFSASSLRVIVRNDR